MIRSDQERGDPPAATISAYARDPLRGKFWPSPGKWFVYFLVWALGTTFWGVVLWQGILGPYGHGISQQDPGTKIAVIPPEPVGRKNADRFATPRPRPVRQSRCGPAPAAGPAPADSAATRSYHLVGGIVVLASTATGGYLVEAGPAPGWRTRLRCGGGWLRVDFSKGDRAAVLIATWNGHPPEVQYNNDV